MAPVRDWMRPRLEGADTRMTMKRSYSSRAVATFTLLSFLAGMFPRTAHAQSERGAPAEEQPREALQEVIEVPRAEPVESPALSSPDLPMRLTEPIEDPIPRR